MGVKKFKAHYEEFELDLTPLLAIIMKLVPVLIITSSFLQLTQIETDLPQVIQEAIKNQETNLEKTVRILIEAHSNHSITLKKIEEDNEKSIEVEAKDKEFNLELFNEKLVSLKKEYPQIFKIELSPDENITYNEIVKIMDESRKPRTRVDFMFIDKKSGKSVQTDFLFPEVTFVNIFN